MSDVVKKSAAQEASEADVEDYRRRLGPFVVAAETTRMAMVFCDAKIAGNPIIFTNDAFILLTGYAREEVLGKSFNFLMKHVATPDALRDIEAALSGRDHSVGQYHCRRKNGGEFWSATFISPVVDADGNVVQYFASFVDVTKHIEQLAHSKMLVDELNHRVKNTLTMVQSIVSQTLRTSTDPTTVRTAIESRLFALSRSHDLLTRENWRGVGLLDLITTATEPFAISGGRKDRLVIAGDNIRMPPRAALALGIAFHELATNAAKYGALSNDTGSILIEWKVMRAQEGDRIVLFWQEKNGPSVTRPTRKGFGSQVLQDGLAQTLQGSVDLDYRPDGLICTMSFPVPQEVLQ
jgi:PAS domain S-box-containing protein